MKNVFFASMLIVGTIMGAGFCSGKEIASYFAKYGLISLLVVPALFLLYYFIFKIFMSFGRREKFDTFDQVNQSVFGKYFKVSNLLVFIIYLVFSAAMFAGVYQIGQMFHSNIVSYTLVAIAFGFALLILLKPFNFLARINGVLIPILILLVLITCIKSFSMITVAPESFVLLNSTFLLFFNPLIYACQGLALAYFIMVKAGEQLTKKQINMVALLSSFLLCILQAFAIIVFCFNPETLISPMPFVAMAMKIGLPFDFLYLITLLIAILTTLLATSRALNEIVLVKIKSKVVSGVLSLTCALVFSIFGFDKIIEWFYPIIGVIGFLILALVLHKLVFVNFFKFTNKKIHSARK